MKKLIGLSILTGLLFCLVAKADDVITENINISPNVSRVEFALGHNLYIKQGKKAELKVVMNKRIKDVVDISSSDNTLKLGYKIGSGVFGNLFGTDEKPDISGEKLDYYLTIPDLSKLDARSSGYIEISDFSIDHNLELCDFGSGSIRVGNIKADTVTINATGSGRIEFKKIIADTFKLEVKGSGKNNINQLIAHKLTVALMGSGDVEIESGNVDRQEIKMMGSADYNSKNLKSNSCDVKIFGSGEADVKVKNSVSLKTFGSGHLNVYGNPKHKDISTFGSGYINFKQ